MFDLPEEIRASQDNGLPYESIHTHLCGTLGGKKEFKSTDLMKQTEICRGM